MTANQVICPIGLDHVVLRVADVERSISFYRDVLGFAVERRVDQVGLVQLRAGHSLVDLVALDSLLGRANLEQDTESLAIDPETKRAARNMDHFAIALSEFDEPAIRAQLARYEVEADETRRLYGADGFGPSIYLRDPDGNMLELKGPTEPRSRLDPNANTEA